MENALKAIKQRRPNPSLPVVAVYPLITQCSAGVQIKGMRTEGVGLLAKYRRDAWGGNSEGCFTPLMFVPFGVDLAGSGRRT